MFGLGGRAVDSRARDSAGAIAFNVCAGVLVAAATIAVLVNPLVGGAGLGAVFVLVILFLVPKRSAAGVLTLSALGLLILVPVQEIGHLGQFKVVILAGVLVLVVVAVIRRGGSLRERPRGMWLLALYFGVLAAASATNPAQSNWSLYQGVLIAGGGLALMGAMLSVAERRFVAAGIILIAALEGAYALFEVAANRPALWGTSLTVPAPSQIFSGLTRAEGTLGSPLPLALVMVVAIALLLRGYGPRKIWPRTLIIVICIGGSLAAGSRSAFVISLCLLLFGYRKRLWKVASVGVFGVVLALVLLAAAGFFSSYVFQNFISGDSVSHRNGAFDAVPSLLGRQDVLNVIFGNGYYSARTLFDRGLLQEGRFYAVDNQFVLTLVEGGIVAVLILLVLLARALRVGGPERLGLIAVVVFFLVFDLLAWPSGMALFGVLIGMSFANSGHDDRPEIQGVNHHVATGSRP